MYVFSFLKTMRRTQIALIQLSISMTVRMSFTVKKSYVGHSWKIIPTIKRNPDISRMIVVAIDNDGLGRMNEYAAWKFQESNIPGQQFGGKGVEYAEFVMEVVKPLSMKTIEQSLIASTLLWLDLLWVEILPSLLAWSIKPDWLLWVSFHQLNWLHQEAFDRYMERKKLLPDQRVFIYVGTEEADDTDKTLMAGNIKQAYIDLFSSLLS